MNCSNCKQELSSKAVFCSKCQQLNMHYQFDEPELQKEFEHRMSLVSATLDQPVKTEYMWDTSVAQLAQKVEQVKALLETEWLRERVTKKMFKDLDNLLARCQSAEFHIALVGAIKAGKSTLINAILGHDLASTRVTPETASLTKFRSAKDHNFIKVTFYSQDEWSALWKSAQESRAQVFIEEYEKLDAESIKNDWLDHEALSIQCETIEELKEEIHKWTSSKSATHYFVKEVEVGLVDFNMPEGVIFVDTPGLDDVVAYRSDITRDYINRANAVLVCVKSDALTGPEMATIYSVFANTRYNREKVYVIATQLDTLNRPTENWKEQRVEWLKYISGEGAYGSIELAERNLIPVSGYLYTLLQKIETIEESSDAYFDLASILMKFRVLPQTLNEHLQTLLDFTGIEALKNQLQIEVVNKHKKLLIEDITESYQMCREDIIKLSAKIEETQYEMLKDSEKDIAEIRASKLKYEQEVLEVKEEKEELEQFVDTVQTVTTARVKKLSQSIKELSLHKNK